MDEDTVNQHLENLRVAFGQETIDRVIHNYPSQFEYYCRLYKFYFLRNANKTELIANDR